jgi:hypothetical protein
LCDDTSVEKIKKPHRGDTLVDKITKKIKEPQSGETKTYYIKIIFLMGNMSLLRSFNISNVIFLLMYHRSAVQGQL